MGNEEEEEKEEGGGGGGGERGGERESREGTGHLLILDRLLEVDVRNAELSFQHRQ